MDDGLQNPQLAKDLTIAVVDGGRGLGNGRVIPAGPLRAPLDFQLELADAIVVNDAAPGAGDQRRRLAAAPLQRAGAALHDGRRADDASWLAGPARRRLGRHRRAAALLRACWRRWAPRLSSASPFATTSVWRCRCRAPAGSGARSIEAILVTTEKDLARLEGAPGCCLPSLPRPTRAAAEFDARILRRER